MRVLSNVNVYFTVCDDTYRGSASENQTKMEALRDMLWKKKEQIIRRRLIRENARTKRVAPT